MLKSSHERKRDVSAKKEKKGESAWVFKENEDTRWEKCSQKKKVEGKKKANSLRVYKVHKVHKVCKVHKVLRKVNRFGKKKEFEEVKERGKLYQTPLFGLLVLKDRETETRNKKQKFGWVISKKISKKAVARNRIKRLLAEAIRKNLNKFPEGIRIIFLVKKEILGKSLNEIEDEISNLKVT